MPWTFPLFGSDSSISYTFDWLKLTSTTEHATLIKNLTLSKKHSVVEKGLRLPVPFAYTCKLYCAHTKIVHILDMVLIQALRPEFCKTLPSTRWTKAMFSFALAKIFAES